MRMQVQLWHEKLGSSACSSTIYAFQDSHQTQWPRHWLCASGLLLWEQLSWSISVSTNVVKNIIKIVLYWRGVRTRITAQSKPSAHGPLEVMWAGFWDSSLCCSVIYSLKKCCKCWKYNPWSCWPCGIHVECTWTALQFYFFYCLFTVAMVTLGLACFLPDHIFFIVCFIVFHTALGSLLVWLIDKRVVFIPSSLCNIFSLFFRCTPINYIFP
jgi:hypothetical protein